jgi:PAS domain S-box-containing protein
MNMKKTHNFLFGTLRGRLILSVAAVHAVLMMLFIIDLTSRQRDMLMERQENDAIALSHALSTTASGWLASKDISGLQELVEAQHRYPELLFAILTDTDGHILAHTDNSKIGKFVLDMPRQVRQTVINKTPNLVDVAVPALLAGRHIGWVRIGLGQNLATKKLNEIILNGTLYAILAILIGSFIAWLMGSQITRRLYAIQHTVSEVSAGNPSARSQIKGTDEAAQLANEFNAMLDTLSEREEKINKSESRFAKLFNLAAVPMCFINKNGVVVDYNKRFEQIFGYTKEDIPTTKEWWQLAYPDPNYRKLMVSGWETEVRKASEQKRNIFPSECKITCKNGKVRTFMASGTVINDDLLATFYDITNRKKAEEELLLQKNLLKTIIESSSEAIFAKDKDGKYQSINEAGAKMLGFKVNEIIGRTDFDLLPIETAVEFQKTDEYVFTSNKYYEREEKAKIDGKTFTFLAHKAPWRDNSGQTIGVIGVSNDITERKHTEQELIKAKERAEESDSLKSAFLANMSHEIRTPMNGILGFAELLKEPGLSGKDQQEYIRIIEESGVRMLNIINDIVDISKIESNQMIVSISETSINEKIEYIFNFFKPEAAKKGIKLVFKNGLPANESFVNTDSEKVYAILTNLVKNAIKFTDHGVIEFGYSLKADKEPAELEFFVKDTGIGIPKDKEEAIFDRFVQADISDKRAFQGAGLGLSISKAYVEMLGGKIWMESEEGKGSCFYFTIPYNTEPKKETIDIRPIAAEKELVNQNKDLKILIVEDDEISKRLLSKAVKRYSQQILNAATGVEAVEICHNNPDIDLVMMDVNMPLMNGYEATRKIRQFNNYVIIIAQTAYGMPSDQEEAMAAGCNDYISKPININFLSTLIEKYF